jgi:transposase
VDWGLNHRDIEGIEGIGVDEIAHSKGHKYFTLVYQIDQGMRRLIWIGSDRKEETFREFFDWFGYSRCSKNKAVCSDM